MPQREIHFERENFPIVQGSSLEIISRSHTLRCDAKQAELRFTAFEDLFTHTDYFYLGDFLPQTFKKGSQPRYLETVGNDIGVPVINTLAIQNLTINLDACRYISQDDFDELSGEKKLVPGDVLLTVDGGTSIGKPVLFEMEDDFTVDSHVAILRPEGIEPIVLVYLLASPFGQIQFLQAESGASGQTSVTESDIRRFKFPKMALEKLTNLVVKLNDERISIQEQQLKLQQQEQSAWLNFNIEMLNSKNHQ